MSPYASPGMFIGTGIVSLKSDTLEGRDPSLLGSRGEIGTIESEVNKRPLHKLLILIMHHKTPYFPRRLKDG